MRRIVARMEQAKSGTGLSDERRPTRMTRTLHPGYASPNNEGKRSMKVSDAIAEILRREGVEIVIGYPVNHILERGAAAGIRPIIVRQERIGLHMADAIVARHLAARRSACS